MRRFTKFFSAVGREHQNAADTLATLLLAAQEDDEFRARLEFILGLSSLQRQSLVNTALHEMEVRGEPAAARAALAVLATDEGARMATRMLALAE